VNIAIMLPIDIRRSPFGYRRRCYHPRDVSRLRNVNSSRITSYAKSNRDGNVIMSDLVNLVMKVAANELLHQEANQVDQEMKELLTEMTVDPLVDGRLEDLTLRFFALLKRRSGVAQRALGLGETAFRGLFAPSAGLDGAPQALGKIAVESVGARD